MAQTEEILMRLLLEYREVGKAIAEIPTEHRVRCSVGGG